MERKTKKGVRKLVVLFMTVCAFVIVFCVYKLQESEQEYALGDAAYENIGQVVLNGQETEATDTHDAVASPEATAEILPTTEMPDIGLDFAALSALYENAGAWLYCPETVINYPVMIAEDYSYYLKHLPDGTINKNGALFTDYNCAGDFSDRLSIIYGHNMKSGKMFGSLDMYKDVETLKSHPYLYLYTEAGSYRLEPMYGLVIGANVWRDEGFAYQENVDALMERAKKDATVLHELSDFSQNCRIMALSTCTYEFDNARFVVLCAMRQENGILAEYVSRSTDGSPAEAAEKQGG